MQYPYRIAVLIMLLLGPIEKPILADPVLGDYTPPGFADIKTSRFENGQLVDIDESTILIIGQAGGLDPLRANSSNILLHKAGNTLHIVDSGALPKYRRAILDAAAKLGTVEAVVLVNTHAHTDHVANNDVIYDIPAKERFLLMTRLTAKHSQDQAAYYASGTGRLQEFAPLMPDRIKTVDSTREEWVRLLEPFEPMRPMLEKVTPVEHLPLQRLQFGDVLQVGRKATDHMYIITARGHTDDSVVVYFPKNKLLFMGDETNRAYHIFLDGDIDNSLRLFRDTLQMIDAGEIETIVDSHHYHLFQGEEARLFMQHLLLHEEYEQQLVVTTLLCAGELGLRLDELVRELSKDEWWNGRYKPGKKSGFPISIPMMLLKRMRDMGLDEYGESPNIRFRIRGDPNGLPVVDRREAESSCSPKTVAP